MRLWRILRTNRLRFFVLPVLVLAVAGSAYVGAQQFSPELPPVQVSLDVDDTVLTVEGFTAPGFLVTFMRDGNSIGTTTADGGGNFSKTFTAQTPGMHTISVFASSSEHTTDTVSKTVSLTAQAETTVHFFLPTTLHVSSTQVTRGSPVTFAGDTVPGGTVTLTLNNNLHMTTAAGSSGAWSHTMDTDRLHTGMHHVFAVVNDASGNQSAPTSTRAFQVLPEAVPEPDEEPPEDIPAPEITQPRSNERFPDPPITVEGVALPNAQVELWDGEEVVGSVFANHLGEWHMEFSLSEAQHALRARACVENRCSEYSETVTIFYDAPEPVSSLMLQLQTHRFANVPVNRPVKLDVFYGGGTSPYEITVDWGGPETERIPRERSGTVQPKHRYEQPGKYTGVVHLRDSDGVQRSVHFSVSVVEPSAVRAVVLGAVVATGAAISVVIGSHFAQRSIPILGTIFVIFRRRRRKKREEEGENK